MTTPSEQAMKRAREIVAEHNACGAYDFLIPDIARAIDIPDGFLRTSDGVDRKVLGTLPTLADGTLCGIVDDDYEIERLWSVHPANGEIAECSPRFFWSGMEDWRVQLVGSDVIQPLSWCYSTREAAESARTHKETGNG